MYMYIYVYIYIYIYIERERERERERIPNCNSTRFRASHIARGSMTSVPKLVEKEKPKLVQVEK